MNSSELKEFKLNFLSDKSLANNIDNGFVTKTNFENDTVIFVFHIFVPDDRTYVSFFKNTHQT